MARRASQAARKQSMSVPTNMDENPAIASDSKIHRSDTVKTTDTTKPKRPRFDSNPFKVASSYHLHDEPRFLPFDLSQDHEVEEKAAFVQDAAEYRDIEAARAKQHRTRRQSVKEFFTETIPSETDDLSTLRRMSTLKSIKGDYVVSWKGEDDPEHPRNWKTIEKWKAAVLLSLYTFMAPFTSSMIAPCLNDMAKDLGVTAQFEKTLLLSIFILAFAVGPLIFGPISEVIGRVPVVQATNGLYLVFNLACGAAQNGKQMLAFRFLAGLGGSVAGAVGGGVLGDCWEKENRGRAAAIYSLAPLLGPAIGPIAGGYIGQYLNWRYVFWVSSIMDVVIQIIGLCLLRETYPPRLLQNRARRLRKETGDEKYVTQYELTEEPMAKKLKDCWIRPIKMLGTQPLVQGLAIFMAYVYGLTFIVYATFSTLWTNRYGQTMSQSGLHYIAPSIGFFIGTQLVAPLSDKIYKRLEERYNGEAKPEYRVVVAMPGTLLIIVGLLWYGWSAQAKLHWVMPDIGIMLFACGCDIIFQCVNVYLVECYTRYASSASACTMFLRSLCAFGFPLFAQPMYNDLGYGFGNSTLALVVIVVGLPAPFALWRWGATLRQKSRFAAGE